MNYVNAHPKLSAVISELVSDARLVGYDYFGHFGLYLNYKSTDKIPTCGVSSENGRATYYYNPKFLEELTHKQLMFVYMHEIMHLVGDHMGRCRRSNFDPRLSNIAADMIINESLLTKNYLPQDRMEMPAGVRMDKDYTGAWILESLYEYLNEKNEDKPKCPKCGGSGESKEDQDGDGDGQSGDGDGQDGEGNGSGEGGKKPCDCCNGTGQGNGQSGEGQLGQLDGANGETLDTHMECEEQNTLTSQVREIMDSLKARGIGTAELHRELEGLRRPKENYLRHVKRVAALMKGACNKIKTLKRPNRRGIYGLKGRQKQAQSITCVLDTSGSMWGEFEKVLSTINREGLEIDLIHCDTQIKKIDHLTSRADIAKVKVDGGGGTELQPGIDYATKHFPKGPVVVLTDGYCDSLDFSKTYGPGLVITTGVEVKVLGGNVTQCVIDKEAS